MKFRAVHLLILARVDGGRGGRRGGEVEEKEEEELEEGGSEEEGKEREARRRQHARGCVAFLPRGPVAGRQPAYGRPQPRCEVDGC